MNTKIKFFLTKFYFSIFNRKAFHNFLNKISLKILDSFLVNTHHA